MNTREYKIRELTYLVKHATDEVCNDVIQIMIFMQWRSGKKFDCPEFTPVNIILGCIKFYEYKLILAVRTVLDYLDYLDGRW